MVQKGLFIPGSIVKLWTYCHLHLDGFFGKLNFFIDNYIMNTHTYPGLQISHLDMLFCVYSL